MLWGRLRILLWGGLRARRWEKLWVTEVMRKAPNLVVGQAPAGVRWWGKLWVTEGMRKAPNLVVGQAPARVRWWGKIWVTEETSNGSWCMGIKGEMSGTVCGTFTWDMYIYIYIWIVYSVCFFCCLFITVTWRYVWCIEWASGNQEEVHVQACLVTLWLFIISCYSLYKTTLGLLCSWFENNPHFHKYSMDFHV